MKRLFAFALAILMVVSLAACGKDNNSTVPSTDPSSDPSATESNVSLGTTTGQTYYNEFLGLGCTIPDDWTFYTEEQILEMNNLALGLIDSEIAQQIKNATIIYDMTAVNSDSLQNININMEKLNSIALAYGVENLLSRQIDSVKTVYQNAGYTNINITTTKVTVDGQEFHALKTTAKLQGYSTNAVVFSFIKDNYMANIAITCVKENAVDEILSWFTVD